VLSEIKPSAQVGFIAENEHLLQTTESFPVIHQKDIA
jgi:hypothetical protein